MTSYTIWSYSWCTCLSVWSEFSVRTKVKMLMLNSDLHDIHYNNGWLVIMWYKVHTFVWVRLPGSPFTEVAPRLRHECQEQALRQCGQPQQEAERWYYRSWLPRPGALLAGAALAHGLEGGVCGPIHQVPPVAGLCASASAAVGEQERVRVTVCCLCDLCQLCLWWMAVVVVCCMSMWLQCLPIRWKYSMCDTPHSQICCTHHLHFLKQYPLLQF